MKRLLDAGDAKTFDEMIWRLLDTKHRVSASMFGTDRGRGIRLTRREHEEMTRDVH